MPCIPKSGLILKEHCGDTVKDWTIAAIAEEGTHLLPKVWLAKVKSKPVGTREQAAAGVPDLSSSGRGHCDSLELPPAQTSLKATLSLWWIWPPWAEILLCLSSFSTLLYSSPATHTTLNEGSSHSWLTVPSHLKAKKNNVKDYNPPPLVMWSHPQETSLLFLRV